jgi:hypothetical protein
MKKVAYLTIASFIAFYAGQASAGMIKDDKICSDNKSRTVASNPNKFDIVGKTLNKATANKVVSSAKRKKIK